MALRYDITKAEHDTLPEHLKGEYKEVENKPGFFRLELVDNPMRAYRENNERLTRELREITESHASEKAKREQIEATLAKYRDEDGNPLDADEIKRLRKELTDKAGGKKDAKVEDAIAAALSPLQRTITDLQKALTDQKAATEENAKKARRAGLVAALREIGDPVLVPQTAGYVIDEAVNGDYFDFDPDTKAITPKKTDADGSLITPQRFFDTKRAATPNLFKQNGAPGGPPARVDGSNRRGGIEGDSYVVYNPNSLELGQASEAARKAGKKLVVRRD